MSDPNQKPNADNDFPMADAIPVAEVAEGEAMEAKPIEAKPIEVKPIGKPKNAKNVDTHQRSNRILFACLAIGGICLVGFVLFVGYSAFNAVFSDDGFSAEFDSDHVGPLGLQNSEQIRTAFEFDLESPVEVRQFEPWFDRLTIQADAEEEGLSARAKKGLVDHELLLMQVYKQGWKYAKVNQDYYLDYILDIPSCPQLITDYRIVSAFKDELFPDGYIVYAYVEQLNEINMARFWLRKRGARWKAYDWQRIDHGSRSSMRLAMEFADEQTNFDSFAIAEYDANVFSEDNRLEREQLQKVSQMDLDPRAADRVLVSVCYAWSRGLRYDKVLELVETAKDPASCPGLFYAKALAQYGCRQFEAAIKSCNENIATVGNNPECWEIIGNCQVELGQIEEAARSYQNAFRCYPSSYSYFGSLASTTESKDVKQLLDLISQQDDSELLFKRLVSRYFYNDLFDHLKIALDYLEQKQSQTLRYDFYRIYFNEKTQTTRPLPETLKPYESLLKISQNQLAENEEDTDSVEYSDADSVIYMCLDRILNLAIDQSKLLETYQACSFKDEFYQFLHEWDEYDEPQIRQIHEQRYTDDPNDVQALTSLFYNTDATAEGAAELAIQLLKHPKRLEDESPESVLIPSMISSFVKADKSIELFDLARDKPATFLLLGRGLQKDMHRLDEPNKQKQMAQIRRLVEAFEKYLAVDTPTSDPWLNFFRLYSNGDLPPTARQQQLCGLFASDNALDNSFDFKILETIFEIGDLNNTMRRTIEYELRTKDYGLNEIADEWNYSSRPELIDRLARQFMAPPPHEKSIVDVNTTSATAVFWTATTANERKDYERVFEVLEKGHRLYLYRRILDYPDPESQVPFSLYQYRELENIYLRAADELGQSAKARELGETYVDEFNDPRILLKTYLAEGNLKAIEQLLEERPDFVDEVASAFYQDKTRLLDLPANRTLRKQFMPTLHPYSESNATFLFYGEDHAPEELAIWQTTIQNTIQGSTKWVQLKQENNRAPDSKSWTFSHEDRTYCLTLAPTPIIQSVWVSSPQLHNSLNKHRSWLSIVQVAAEGNTAKDNSSQDNSLAPILPLIKTLLESTKPTVVYLEGSTRVMTADQFNGLSIDDDPQKLSHLQGWLYFSYEVDSDPNITNTNRELKRQLDSVQELSSTQLRIKASIYSGSAKESLWMDVDEIKPGTWNEYTFVARFEENSILNAQLNHGLPFEVLINSVEEFDLQSN